MPCVTLHTSPSLTYPAGAERWAVCVVVESRALMSGCLLGKLFSFPICKMGIRIPFYELAKKMIWVSIWKVTGAPLGLPWWRSGWESACQCRGHGFEPWSKIPHAAEQLGPWATITESARLEPVLRNGRGHDSERPVHRNEEWPPLTATGESPRTETKTQHSHKINK